MAPEDALKEFGVVAGDRIAVWFSCGAASAIAARETLRLFADHCDVRIVNSRVAEEGADNIRFLNDVSAWLGVPIEQAENPKFPSNSAYDVWESRRYMSGVMGAPCTVELKKEPRYVWEILNSPKHTVLGFTVDEQHRHEKFCLTERVILPVLIRLGVTKQDCFNELRKAGIELPEAYRLGYPNANCRGCVKASSPEYWNHVRRTDPEAFNARAEQSARLGAKLVRYKGERIFLSDLPPEARGRRMKSDTFDCGIFCEERKRK